MTQLNDEQRAALEADGDVLLVACPGSGKTRTLIYKIAAELERIKTHREFVVALTYTHVAAEEIRDRIDAMGIDTTQLWVGTIHSFCLNWILRPYYLYHDSLKNGFAVIDTFETEELLDQLAKSHPPLRSHHDCKYYATESGYSLDRSMSADQKQALNLVLEKYHAHLLDRKLIDFEMMLEFSYDLLLSHRPIATRLGQLIRFVAIDEYQDTRDIQYSIVAKIIRESQNQTSFFMVGDPNQSIFGSLGGVAKSQVEIETLTGRSVQKLALHRNYRSSQVIVDYFGNFAVTPMKITASGELSDWPSSIVHDTSVAKVDLIQGIVRVVRLHTETFQTAPENICIVAPWWMHLAPITRALVRELPELNFNGPGLSPFGQNLDNFWFKVARIALTSAAPDVFRKRIRWAQEVVDDLVAHGYLKESFTARDLLKLTNGIVVDSDLGTVFLKSYFEEFCFQMGFEPAASSELFEQRESFFARMANRLASISEKERVDVDDLETFRRVFRPRNGVVVSTIHGVKGAEFDVVIAFGLLEDIVPHFGEPEDEKEAVAKRLLFVIGSRARKHLYLISETGRGTRYYPKFQSRVLLSVKDYPYASLSVMD
ncbi:UvrD-helicase domain-containing protein [Pseudoclavibacter helvolus]|uniref:UvrD-helicase domain-containing protein n=1 Tax=Pseudoclavibacter helvolus TaxID=255205 RepID=UPI003735AE87